MYNTYKDKEIEICGLYLQKVTLDTLSLTEDVFSPFKLNGYTNLRFDDTNPTKEKMEFVDSIKEDIKWLGADWGEHLYFASDYFDRMYECAVRLILRWRKSAIFGS